MMDRRNLVPAFKNPGKRVGVEPPANRYRQAARPSTEQDTLIHVAVAGGRAFVNNYYKDLHDKRSNLARYYTPDASISWNGNQLTGGDDFVKLYEKMPSTTFEVQCYDATPLMPDGKGSCTIMLLTNGYIKMGDEKDQPLRGFSESFILAPDGTPRGFLVANQSFRITF